VRARIERVLLGRLMAALAFVLDRRLRKLGSGDSSFLDGESRRRGGERRGARGS
jgi:hypothetical protein